VLNIVVTTQKTQWKTVDLFVFVFVVIF